MDISIHFKCLWLHYVTVKLNSKVSVGLHAVISKTRPCVPLRVFTPHLPRPRPRPQSRSRARAYPPLRRVGRAFRRIRRRPGQC